MDDYDNDVIPIRDGQQQVKLPKLSGRLRCVAGLLAGRATRAGWKGNTGCACGIASTHEVSTG